MHTLFQAGLRAYERGTPGSEPSRAIAQQLDAVPFARLPLRGQRRLRSFPVQARTTPASRFILKGDGLWDT